MYRSINVKRVIASASVVTFGVAVFQGMELRHRYLRSRKMSSPIGPTSGVETADNSDTDQCNNKFENKLDGLKSFMKNLKSRIMSEDTSSHFQKTVKDASHKTHSQRKKKIKLLVVGDSLVSGVGCASSGPVLPRYLAKALAIALKVDIEWKSAGIIGGTARDLRNNILPSEDVRQFLQITEDSTATTDAGNTEFIVVVICGLNDWKHAFENFPMTLYGPDSFRKELLGVVEDLKQQVKGPCRVYLPAVPFTCGFSDPAFMFQIKPLSYIVSAVGYVWDLQKRNIAFARQEDHGEGKISGDTTFIDSPDVSRDYATPGAGNISEDGIHPSPQGYAWWALHIAESIIKDVEKL